MFISILSIVDVWKYGNLKDSPRSSVTILAGSLISNQTYQFKVDMIDRQQHTNQETGYLLVHIKDRNHQMIIIRSVIYYSF